MSQVRSLGGTEYQGWLGPKSLSRLDPRDDFVFCCGTWALIRALRGAKKLFLLDGVATFSEEATASAQDPWALVAADRERILSQESASVSPVRLFELLPRHSIAPAMKLLETSKPMASLAIELLTTVDVLNESTGKKRHRLDRDGSWIAGDANTSADADTLAQFSGFFRPRLPIKPDQGSPTSTTSRSL